MRIRVVGKIEKRNFSLEKHFERNEKGERGRRADERKPCLKSKLKK